ncbi:hypothetical protein AN963_07980 [Brevibacillus choshinensis]|uniref:Ureidoglycolate hydrolase n=1 Tax=Brevibacillus choshinensis TaxID=54911 RepID=A0ABR5NDP6_BRECH|nr:ureidoglycolate lyase [Brevibacillus choshinensis]KQL49651.1 hypothetical protein AN963_07980 [Brevibacillus choshinensis]
MNVKAVPVSSIDFSKYGTYYHMKENTSNVWHSQGEGWEDSRTNKPLINTPGTLGFTLGSPAPCMVSTMERHLHTQEALFCLSEPIVVALAISSDNEQPHASDIEAVLIQPGEVIVLNEGVWHDACHGINKSSHYYWMATESDEPTEWVGISGGPIALAY